MSGGGPPSLEFGEHQADALGVQRLVEFGQDIGSGGVHIGHGLRRDQDPGGLRLRLGQPADLVAERGNFARPDKSGITPTG